MFMLLITTTFSLSNQTTEEFGERKGKARVKNGAEVRWPWDHHLVDITPISLWDKYDYHSILWTRTVRFQVMRRHSYQQPDLPVLSPHCPGSCIPPAPEARKSPSSPALVGKTSPLAYLMRCLISAWEMQKPCTSSPEPQRRRGH